MGIMEARAWARAWLQAWPRMKTVALEVEENVRLSGRPWAEVWTLAEATIRAKVDVEVHPSRANAEAWRAWGIRGWSSWEDDLGRRISKMTEPATSLERSKPEMDVVTQEFNARWKVEILALALAGVWGWARSEARARGERPPRTLADSSIIWRILTTLIRSGLARHLWHDSPETKDEYWCIIHFISRSPITRLPIELLHQIFLIIVEEANGPVVGLMLVCKHWHAIVTGIWASLNLGTRTPIDAVTSKLEKSQWFLDIVVDTDSDRGDFTPSDGTFGAIFATMEASSRWRSLVVESFPPQADLPEELVNRHLQQCPNTTMDRFTTLKIKSACETSPLLDRLLNILGTGTMASSELSSMEINSPNVISFLAHAYPSMFNSVKVLTLNTRGMPNPVDLLPHLHQLELLTASHISFPIYHSDIDLPLTRTLRHLSLKAGSIQWMSARTFYVLEDCTLIFPLHHPVLHAFRTTLPNCKRLTFQGAPLDILYNTSACRLTDLSVTCSGSFNRRGDRQLALLWQVFRDRRLAPTILHISIEATNRAWMHANVFMPNLEELVIHNARPSSLGTKVIQALVTQPVHSSNTGAISTPARSLASFCPMLRRFGLKYDRWLRHSEQSDLIQVLMSILQSKRYFNPSLESFSIWMSRDQTDPLELIERSGVSVKGFMHLGKASGISDHLLNIATREPVPAPREAETRHLGHSNRAPLRSPLA